MSPVTVSPSTETVTYQPDLFFHHERPARLLKQRPQVFRDNSLKTPAVKEKPKQSFRPVIDYDYYDDGDVRIVGKANSKVRYVLNNNKIEFHMLLKMAFTHKKQK